MHFGCVQNRFREAFDLFRQLLFQPLFTEQNLQKPLRSCAKIWRIVLTTLPTLPWSFFTKHYGLNSIPTVGSLQAPLESLKSRTLDENNASPPDCLHEEKAFNRIGGQL